MCKTSSERQARRAFLKCAGGGFAALTATSTLPEATVPPKRPNIVYILCDDLGYGDVHCLNPERGKIATPHIDSLARQGMIFTDAHSGSAVCTPTRYGVLTGRYCWRSRLQEGVFNGYSEPLIDEGRMTVASCLRSNGYATALFGKWHLGFGWARVDPARAAGPQLPEPQLKTMREGETLDQTSQKDWDNIDYTRPIRGGPVALGFDYFLGVTAPDFPPFVWVENDRVVTQPERVKRVIRLGVGAPDFEPFELLPTLTRRVADYIGRQAADAKAGKPFFLMFALPAPHSPLVPAKEWQGRSGLGPYGDWVMQTDATVGVVLDALDRSGLADNTLIILTSDNGCAPYVGVRDKLGDDVRGNMRPRTAVKELEEAGHYPSAAYRGYKADLWEGGHRIPFVARWPGKVKPGSTSNQLICLTDLIASCAELLHAGLPEKSGEDSVSIIPALLGTARKPLREAVVHHSVSGRFAIRQGKWKLVVAPGSGGWSQPNDKDAAQQRLPSVQLYDMSADTAEEKNVQAEHPDVVQAMIRLLERYIAGGRSTPGAAQKNDVPVDIWKGAVYSPAFPKADRLRG